MSKKVVAVQNGLNELAQSLSDLGYQVVGVDETQYPLDAIVYSNELSDQPNKVRSDDVNAAVSAVDNDGYVLMLNIDEYSRDEILNRLNDL